VNFFWPGLLLLLLLVPLLIAVYIWNLRRKRRFAVRYSSLSLIREALPRRSRWRQHLPFILFLLSLVCLVVASARPYAEVAIPDNRTTVILTIDVSLSMCATDVAPNRLSVAQKAALAFIQSQADNTRIGLVAFAGLAELVVPPTNDKKMLEAAVENFTTSIGTAIGSATLKAIDAIAEVNHSVAPTGSIVDPESGGLLLSKGNYQPDIIVLLTDGANSRGPEPLDAAQEAADRKIRVYTIGFGTTNPQQMMCSPEQLGTGAFDSFFRGGFVGGFGGGGFDGGSSFRRYFILDEATLKGIADLTGGAYYRAENAQQLTRVFKELPKEMILQKERQEISVFFSVLGALFASVAVMLSILWHRVF
jgi:Ca-activated chloride channel family protein